MKYVIEKDWTTTSGLRAVVAMQTLGHRCGYVGVPAGHPLYEVDYAGDGWEDKQSPERTIEVHGGLTFSGKGDYPVESDLWWFGYDCGHAGDAPVPGSAMARYGLDDDNDVHRTLIYCIGECEALAKQLASTKERNEAKADLTLRAARLMERVGGSFAASIAKAWIVGDSSNKRRVYAAFGDLFERYETWALEDLK